MKLKTILLTAGAALCTLLPTSPAYAENGVAFAYQGRVKVQGQPFDGDGQFKFVIVDTPGASTLWSHDGTSANGAEPSGAISLPVSDGIFNVIIGDTALGMQTINPVIFRSQTPPKLRIWFNDGVRGFQRLLPDHTIVNPEIISYTTGDQDFTIYVRHSDGSDADNGLTTATAKKTIQAAVDVLPERVKCNVLISIEPGVYREEVILNGIMVPQGKKLTLLGDPVWTPDSAGFPSVRITGMNESSVKVRESALRCLRCSQVYFHGLALDGTTGHGFNTDSSLCELDRCIISNTGNNGMIIGSNTHCFLKRCVVEDCVGSGFRIGPQCTALMSNCIARRNTFAGLQVSGQAGVTVTAYCEFKDNADSQVWMSSSNLDLLAPIKAINTHATIAKRGVCIAWMSMIVGYSQVQYQGLLSPQFYESRGASHWD